MTIKGTATSFDAMYGDHESGRASTDYLLVHCMSEPFQHFLFTTKNPLRSGVRRGSLCHYRRNGSAPQTVSI